MIDKENYNVIFQGLDKFFDSSESINTKKKVYGQFEGREFIVNQKS